MESINERLSLRKSIVSNPDCKAALVRERMEAHPNQERVPQDKVLDYVVVVVAPGVSQLVSEDAALFLKQTPIHAEVPNA
jgi:hypothetical protein